AGGVHQEHQVRRRQLGLGHVVALDAHHQQVPARVPGRGRDLGAHAERHFARGRRGVAVAEVVDELLGADRVRRRAHAHAQHAPHVAVAAGVDVDGEGRDRLLGGAPHRVVLEVGVLLGDGRVDRVRARRQHHGRRRGRRRHGHALVGGGLGLRAGAVEHGGGGDRRRRGRRVGDRLLGGGGGAGALAGGQEQAGREGDGEGGAVHGGLRRWTGQTTRDRGGRGYSTRSRIPP